MKNKLTLIKIMFGSSILFVALFVGFYIWGIHNCRNIYEMFDCTLPFLFLAMFSIAGLGITQQLFYNDAAEIKNRLPRLDKKNAVKHSEKRDKKHRTDKRFEKRYTIRTYARDGVHTKHINLRGDYGMLRSA